MLPTILTVRSQVATRLIEYSTRSSSTDCIREWICLKNHRWEGLTTGQAYLNLFHRLANIILCAAVLTASAAKGATLDLQPYESFVCSGAECPLNFTQTSGSDTSVEEQFPRSRAKGQFSQTNISEATVGIKFRVCDTAEGKFSISGSFQGLLKGTGGGIINRGRARIALILRDLTNNETIVEDVFRQEEERGKVAQTINQIVGLFEGENFVDGEIQPATTTQMLQPGREYMIGLKLRTEASGLNALSDFNQMNRFAQLFQLGIDLTPQLPDTDGDGLYDKWETEGLKDCDGNILVDLKSMGAKVDHKDVFVEYDWVEGERPDRESIQFLKERFNAAPVDNPDGNNGINLWIDTGSLTEFGLEEVEGMFGTCLDGIDNNDDELIDEDDPNCLVGDNLGGGNEIDPTQLPNENFIPRVNGDGDDNGEPDFFEVKDDNFDFDRRAVSHYAISAPKGGGEDLDLGRASCEDDEDNDGDGLTDAEDKDDCFEGGQASMGANFIVAEASTSTFMHELGHTLGLGHGGNESDNCKPNYLSIMNYSFSGGVPADLDDDGIFEAKTIDYSPLSIPDGRTAAPLGDLREDKLVESKDTDVSGLEPITIILDETDPVHATRWVDSQQIGRTSAVNAEIDWDGEDGIEDQLSQVNVNRGDKDGLPGDCEERSEDAGHPDDETLTGHDDWANLEYRFKIISPLDSSPIEAIPEPPMNPSEADFVYFATDLAISKTVGPDPWVAGQMVSYELTVENRGPNGAHKIEIIETPPEGVVFVNPPEDCELQEDESLRCAVEPLAVGNTTTLSLNARLPIIRDCGRSQFITLSNQAQAINLVGREIRPQDNVAIARHRILCPRFEYTAKFVCGVESNPETHALLAGRYGSVVNIHNPQGETVYAFAKLAMAIPPGEFKAGSVHSIDLAELDYDEAAAVDCNFVREKVFGGQLPAEVIDGFLVIQTARSVDVSAVYTRSALQYETERGSVDIERVAEREFSPPPPKADLTPEILALDIVCATGLNCKTSIRYQVENIGDEDADPFSTRFVLEPGRAEVGTDPWPEGLEAQTAEIRSIGLTTAASELASAEKICIEADQPANNVDESDEDNNIDCVPVPGF